VANARKSEGLAVATRAPGEARARVLETAYELFCRYGIRRVGIDRIVAESGVAKMTLYRHFASKDDLVLAFLDLREQRWTREWLEAEIERLAASPGGSLLGIFDALDEWFGSPDFDGCAFINTLLEIHDRSDPVHQQAVRHLDVIRDILKDQAQQAGVGSPEEIAYQLQILMMGATVSASRGDRSAAGRARELAELLLQADR
jgi:AcrR family transcriptional regulator